MDDTMKYSEFPNSSDCISRQAAIEIVDRYNKSHMILQGKPMLGAESIVIELEALSSAQPERKCGKWEEKAVSDEKVIDEWQSARCSACGKYHTTPYMYYFDNYNYCPNCGARMTKEDV